MGNPVAFDASADQPVSYPAFEITPVDTTGCGDVFHGVYAACLAQDKPLDTRILLASAAAALKTLHVGAQRGIPTRLEIEDFLRNQR